MAADKLGGVVTVRGRVIRVIARPPAAEMRLCDHGPDLINGDRYSADALAEIIRRVPQAVEEGRAECDDDRNDDWATEVPLAMSCLTLTYVEHCSRYFSGMLLLVTRDHLRVVATIRPQSCNREPHRSVTHAQQFRIEGDGSPLWLLHISMHEALE